MTEALVVAHGSDNAQTLCHSVHALSDCHRAYARLAYPRMIAAQKYVVQLNSKLSLQRILHPSGGMRICRLIAIRPFCPA